MSATTAGLCPYYRGLEPGRVPASVRNARWAILVRPFWQTTGNPQHWVALRQTPGTPWWHRSVGEWASRSRRDQGARCRLSRRVPQEAISAVAVSGSVTNSVNHLPRAPARMPGTFSLPAATAMTDGIRCKTSYEVAIKRSTPGYWTGFPSLSKKRAHTSPTASRSQLPCVTRLGWEVGAVPGSDQKPSTVGEKRQTVRMAQRHLSLSTQAAAWTGGSSTTAPGTSCGVAVERLGRRVRWGPRCLSAP